MALRKGAPLLAAGAVVAVVVILAVGAVSQVAPASGSYHRSVDEGYATLAEPFADQSNSLGAELTSFLKSGPTLGRVDFFESLDALASYTSELTGQFDEITPPEPVQAATSCESAMRARSDAVSQFRGALEALLGGPTGTGPWAGNEPRALSALTSVGTSLEASDASWARCRSLLRRAPGSAVLRASLWVPDEGEWAQGALENFVSAVDSSSTLQSRRALAILSATTEQPSPPSATGQLLVAPATSLAIDVVVANQGNVDLAQVDVAVMLAPVASGAPSSSASQSQTVSRPLPARVDAQDAVALVIGGLHVSPGNSYTLQVAASSAGAHSGIVSIPLQVEQAVSSTVVFSSSSSVAVGLPVTYSAVITSAVGGLGAPTGTLTFEDDGNTIASCVSEPVQDSKASCSVSYPAVGAHAVTAVYSGDQVHSASTSAPLIEKVTAAPRRSRSSPGRGRGRGGTTKASVAP